MLKKCEEEYEELAGEERFCQICEEKKKYDEFGKREFQKAQWSEGRCFSCGNTAQR